MIFKQASFLNSDFYGVCNKEKRNLFASCSEIDFSIAPGTYCFQVGKEAEPGTRVIGKYFSQTEEGTYVNKFGK